MTLDVESVVDYCMPWEKPLCLPGTLETLHPAFPSSGRLMWILRSVVAPSAALMAVRNPEIMGRGSIRPQLICDELVWDKAIFIQELAHQFKRRPLVAFGLDQNVEHFTLGIHGTPDQAPIYLEIDIIEMPDGVRLRPMVYQAAHGLIGHQDSMLSQQILDVAEAQGEPNIKPDCLLDDFGMEAVGYSWSWSSSMVRAEGHWQQAQ
jgi:hypothetical protein